MLPSLPEVETLVSKRRGNLLRLVVSGVSARHMHYLKVAAVRPRRLTARATCSEIAALSARGSHLWPDRSQ